MDEPDPGATATRDAGTPGTASAIRAEPDRALVEIAPDVWVATAEIWTTTSTVVVGPDGDALVVDPAVTVAEIEALAATIRSRGWIVRAGFATHPHWDHVLWSRSLGDGPRWASARAVADLHRRAAAVLSSTQTAAPGHDPALVGALDPLPRGATRLPWPGGAASEQDGARVVVHDAHAPGHAALVAQGALIAGDMLSDVEVPLVDTDSRDPVGTYRGALDALELAAREVDVLVPGHGTPAVGRASVAERFAADRAYLDALESAVARPGTGVATVTDPRLVGYVATWHGEQLAALRAR